jgi:hypothetical protein
MNELDRDVEEGIESNEVNRRKGRRAVKEEDYAHITAIVDEMVLKDFT